MFIVKAILITGHAAENWLNATDHHRALGK